ncbi:MAG: T9SS-dependent M36 family metallopeptidase [Flavobacteriaceae bacterium]|jgi:hypothetical protein|nr:T9SS-dependent M36 family metallopeptidase [Flavobacteriaceae bacterium]
MKNRKLPYAIAFLALAVSANLYAQDHRTVIQNYLKTSAPISKNVQNKEFIVNNEDPSKSMKADVVKIQQSFNGLPIFNHDATLLIRENQVLNFMGDFTQNVPSDSNINNAMNAESVLSTAVSNMNLGNPEVYTQLLENGNMLSPYKMYFDNGNELILAYYLEFPEQQSSNYWAVVADAKTGEILSQQNLTLSCNFSNEPYGHIHSENQDVAIPAFLPQPQSENKIVTPFLANTASYNVFAFPVEAPTFGSRSMEVDPWDLTTSPQGWQNDGTTEYNITRGNNVHTYLDELSTNAIGASADGGANHNFDFSLDLSGSLDGYTNASMTNLFYTNNKFHDVLYRFGFTETAKNFQANNFGNGGNGNDYVLAEARDGAGVPDLSLGIYNNANFATPSDGAKPRMQMYIWLGPAPWFLFNTPPVVAGGPDIPQIGLGYFGPPLWKAGPVTGDVVVSPVWDACTPLAAGSMAGKIGMAQRSDGGASSCDFMQKVYNIQQAGAIGAIIYNNPDNPNNGGEAITNMSGTLGLNITIPSVFIPQSKGEAIKTLVNASQTVNVTLKLPVLDGSLDNGIIVHEYGHGLSNRTTGTTVSCLNTSIDVEQMGEGWSDFVALMMTLRPTDNANVPRGIGTYAVGEPTTGVGIRPTQYSPDFSINDFTYGDTNGMLIGGQIDVHSIGFVWATILWDLHWKYVEKYGWNGGNLLSLVDSGSARVFQMVLDGLKLQGCLPTFVMGRDGILAADQAATGGADKCLIWNVFAKRGVGLNASAGSKTNINDQVEDFTVPTECILATGETNVTNSISIYPNPATNEFFIKGNILGKADVEIYDASGKLVSNQRINPSEKEAINTQRLPNGVYMVKVSGLGFEYSSKVIIKK